MLYLSILAALPLPRPDGFGERTRCGGSRLEERWCCFDIDCGIAGTGGASPRGEVAPFVRPGEGERKVRSVIEPPLSRRCRPPRAGGPPLMLEPTILLVVEDTDPRRTMRLVCRLPTGSGVVVMERKAAAAAAEDNEPVDGLFFRKA